ncbi:hypothetical protein ACFQHO_01460 [Actinomadura yumaensis]|uniref:hypothetical protein n=1 Tax=Actinomadura yumaensis TaxID=111807 RepID=UPI00361BE22A
MTALFASVYPIIQEELGAVGIKVVYKSQPASAGLTPYLSEEFPAYLFSWGSSDNWLDANLLLARNGAWNPFHASDTTIESLMKRIAAASGPRRMRCTSSCPGTSSAKPGSCRST